MHCEKKSRSRRSLAALFIALLGTISLSGCGDYPRVSPAAFETAKAIENLCNLRIPQQLPEARTIVEQREQAGEMTADEAAFLYEILDTADAGDWERASQDARQLLEAQNEHP